jgi:hypothetical protein
MHDPTTLNRQGPDVGTQYRSAIFTHGDEQARTAAEVTEKVSREWWKTPLSTRVVAAGRWWDAEEYHQLYLQNNPMGYECPAQYVSFFSFWCGVWLGFFADLVQFYSRFPASFRLTRLQDLIDISLAQIMHFLFVGWRCLLVGTYQ